MRLVHWLSLSAGLSISTLSLISSAQTQTDIHTPTQTTQHCNQFLTYGNPGGADQYLCRQGYVVGYNYATKQPRWVAYRLTKDSVARTQLKSASFHSDSQVPSTFRSTTRDYQNNKQYKSMQFAPKASIDFSKISFEQSFLLSNTSPQNKALNRLAWRKLEQDTRHWASRYGEVYVYTGPTFDGSHLQKIGNGVFVPTGFFKIIYAPKQEKALAFWLPNKKISPRKLGLYITTIKKIEQQTGLIFLNKLSAALQGKIKISHDSFKAWPTAHA